MIFSIFKNFHAWLECKFKSDTKMIGRVYAFIFAFALFGITFFFKLSHGDFD